MALPGRVNITKTGTLWYKQCNKAQEEAKLP